VISRRASKVRTGNSRRAAIVLSLLLAVTSTAGWASVAPAGAASPAPSFTSEQAFPGGGAYWEPTVAVDPVNSNYVYQAVTYINASKTCGGCPGTAIFVRTSTDGGRTWGTAHPIYRAGGKGWQFDPQLRVATDGTVYAVFLQTFDPGSVLFKSSDHGATWTGPYTMNGDLTYNDKPILVISPSGQDVYVAFNVKLASYVAVSHNYGLSFSLEPTSNESLWWYTYGGTYAPDGSVYFAQAGEMGNKSTGKITNQGHVDGPDKIFVLKLHHDGSVAANTFLTKSATPTPCSIFQCYPDYFAAQAAVAADGAGHLMVAYTFNALNASPHQLYVRTSTNGVTWSSPILVNRLGDSNFPAIVSGPTTGDFRLAWQDNRNNGCWNCGGLGDWETWYTRTTNSGATWIGDVQLSNLGSGAPYKTPEGYNFTDGDYFGLAASPSGTNYVIWGEADGSSTYCCGGAWYAMGP
jgi:hypothetical protein